MTPPDDEDGIAAAVEALLAAHRDNRLHVSTQHAAVAQRYDIRQTTAEFAAVLERCM